MKKIILQATTILFITFSALTNAQWFEQSIPTNNYLYDIFAIDENTAIAVGGENTILKTSDGGENWMSISDSSTEYYYYSSVYFINENIGWIAGEFPYEFNYSTSLILKTSDAGESWTSDSIGSGGLNSVFFVDQNIGWAVGWTGRIDSPSGLMVKTIDGGNNWISQNGIPVSPLSFVFFINQNIGWIGSSWRWIDSTIFKSTDGGITWMAQSIDSISCQSGYFINENIGWVTGRKPNGSSFQEVILKTTNGGVNWIEQQFGAIDFLSIYFIDSSIGWAVGSDGTIFKTTDGGNYWYTQESGTNDILTSVDFVNKNTGWVVGFDYNSGGIILKTTNGGGTVPVELTTFTAIAQTDFVELNWTTATETNNHGFEVQRSASNSEFVTVGFVEGNGTTTEEHHYSFKDKDVSGFLRYRLKQVDFDGSYEYSDIVEVEVLGNVSYELAQNYPNPFNPVTNISYTLPAESQVKLSIYNPLGELVETIVNQKQDAGKYDAVWNASNHSSGVYIYTLDAVSLNGSEQMKISKKMLLLR